MKKKDLHQMHGKLVIIGTVVALLATTISTSFTLIYATKYRAIKNENDTLRNGYKKHVLQPHETLTSDHFSLKVEEIKTDKDGLPPYLLVPEGYKFITLTLSVKNMTANDQLFLPEEHLYLRDGSGMKYDLTATKDVQQPVAGTIVVGDTIKGQVGYLVPDAGNDYKVYFDPYGDDFASVGVIDISSLL